MEMINVVLDDYFYEKNSRAMIYKGHSREPLPKTLEVYGDCWRDMNFKVPLEYVPHKLLTDAYLESLYLLLKFTGTTETFKDAKDYFALYGCPNINVQRAMVLLPVNSVKLMVSQKSGIESVGFYVQRISFQDTDDKYCEINCTERKRIGDKYILKKGYERKSLRNLISKSINEAIEKPSESKIISNLF